MLAGAFRGDGRHVSRAIVGLVILAAATTAGAAALLSLRGATSPTVEVVVVLAGAAVTLGFVVAPLVLGAVDPLDPRRFRVLDISAGPLAAVLAAAGLLSIPVLVLLLLAVTAAVVWISHGAAPVLAVVSVVVGVGTCVLAARVSEAVAAVAIRDRRSRELAGLFLVALLVVAVPVGVFLASLEWRGAVPVQLREAASIVSLTPFGAAWALPSAQGGDLAVTALIAIATLGALALAWFLLVRRMLTSIERPIAVRERGGLGWFAVAPGTPGGAVAARSLVYWLRDRRYLLNVVIVPVAAVLTTVPLLVAGVPFEIAVLVPVPVMALMFGWLPHNDLAYDSTAVWMHLASGMRGVSDRVGRLVPIVLIAVPILAVAVTVGVALHGRWAVLPAVAGAAASLFLTGLGLSSIASVVAPYAVTRPGDSAFSQPQRTGSGGVLAQASVMLGALVLSAPALWWAGSSVTGDLSDVDTALWAGLGVGLVVLVAGVAIGSAVFERSGSRLMEFAESS